MVIGDSQRIKFSLEFSYERKETGREPDTLKVKVFSKTQKVCI
jgi:hypothetical protein